MPVCPHDWRKHSCSFCPAESCCIMGVLEALGSEQACLTKPWWLAADRRVCLQAGCQKLIFRRFSVRRSGSSMTVWGCRYLGERRVGGRDVFIYLFCEGPKIWINNNNKKTLQTASFKIQFLKKAAHFSCLIFFSERIIKQPFDIHFRFTRRNPLSAVSASVGYISLRLSWALLSSPVPFPLAPQ